VATIKIDRKLQRPWAFMLTLLVLVLTSDSELGAHGPSPRMRFDGNHSRSEMAELS